MQPTDMCLKLPQDCLHTTRHNIATSDTVDACNVAQLAEVLCERMGAYAGWGLDWLWPFLLGHPLEKIAIIDEV